MESLLSINESSKVEDYFDLIFWQNLWNSIVNICDLNVFHPITFYKEQICFCFWHYFCRCHHSCPCPIHIPSLSPISSLPCRLCQKYMNCRHTIWSALIGWNAPTIVLNVWTNIETFPIVSTTKFYYNQMTGSRQTYVHDASQVNGSQIMEIF